MSRAAGVIGQRTARHRDDRPKSAAGPLSILVDGRVMQDRYHGIGRYVFELLYELSKHDVELIVLHNSDGGRLNLKELLIRPTVRSAVCEVPVASIRSQWVLARALRAFRPDVAFVPYHLSTPLLHGGVPVVSVVHDCIFEHDAEVNRRSAFSRAYGAATRLAIRSATALATPSDAARRDINRFYGVEIQPDSVLAHGVSSGFFAVAPRTRPPGLELPGRYILHVGAQRPHKNLRVLVEAMAVLRHDHPDLGLVLVGQPDPRFPDDAGKLVDSLGLSDRVLRYPHVSDEVLMGLYANAAVFAYPSLIEGFGMPVLEAMAAGLAVVASDAEAVAEVAGEGAVIVPAQETARWVQALDHVLTDQELARGLREKALARAAGYTWARSAERTLALLASVANTTEGRGPNGV